MAKNSSHKPALAGLANLQAPLVAAGVCAVVVVVIGLIVSGNRPQRRPEVAQVAAPENTAPAKTDPQPAAIAQQPSEPPANANVESPIEKPDSAPPAQSTVTPPPISNNTVEIPAPETPADSVTPPPPTQPQEVPNPTPNPAPTADVVASATPTPPPAVPQTSESPAPTQGLPDEQALAAARAQVLEMFGAEARAATNPDLKSQLADKMMKLAGEKNGDPATRYVLYDNARKLYVGAGSVYHARQAAQDLSSAFRMKAAEHQDLIFATYTALSDAKLTDQQREQLQDMLGTSVAVHIREKEVKEADQVSLLRMKVVARLSDVELKRKVSQQRAEALQLKTESSTSRVKVVRPESKKKKPEVAVQSFDAVQMTTATDLTSKGGKLVCGWEFKTNAEMRITHFGLFSKQPEGLFASHPITIWDLENRQPVASGTIPAGDRAVADGLFRFVPINPVLLQANRHYAIVAYFGDNVDRTVSMMNPQQAPIDFGGHFEVIGSRSAFPRDKMAFPDRSDLGVKRATIGPTFRYEALELK